MAKRGWQPRSTSRARNPMRVAIIDSSDPAKPDPTIVRSKSAITAGDARGNSLRQVHRAQTLGPRGRTGAREHARKVPEISEDAQARLRQPVFDHLLERGQ